MHVVRVNILVLMAEMVEWKKVVGYLSRERLSCSGDYRGGVICILVGFLITGVRFKGLVLCTDHICRRMCWEIPFF